LNGLRRRTAELLRKLPVGPRQLAPPPPEEAGAVDDLVPLLARKIPLDERFVIADDALAALRADLPLYLGQRNRSLGSENLSEESLLWVRCGWWPTMTVQHLFPGQQKGDEVW
jgi:hypothetical protein